ncbi:MAG: DUF1574 domain-containing protein [Cyanothece sp. SIO1E1]|nr:DUF1574 domain-containing protein [Cyanothece sp. SIO1E1]
MHPIDKHQVKNYLLHLTRCLRQIIGLPEGSVHVRLRGNILHVLCEGTPIPERRLVLLRVIPSLQNAKLKHLLAVAQPQIYQLSIYGRTSGHKQPDWVAPIYLNQLNRHWLQLQQQQSQAADFITHPEPVYQRQMDRHSGVSKTQNSVPPDAVSPTAVSPTDTLSSTQSSAIVLTNQSLAKRGEPDAIARYLSETLNTLGVAVRVSVKARSYQSKSSSSVADASAPTQPGQTTHQTQAMAVERRLWICCESTYSPDPRVLAEPVSQQLRDLEVEGFRDAVILIQVQGESKPDWVLRVDLTPPEEMLKEWARWGDVLAIDRLLNRALAEIGVSAKVELKENTLHILSSVASSQQLLPEANAAGAQVEAIPHQSNVSTAIVSLLDLIAPQGIHTAVVYGQVVDQDTPAWVEWLELPAASAAAFSEPTLELAKHQDLNAIAFLIERRLNPDIDWQLATGGIRTQILARDHLLHVMVDGPTCPKQRQIAPIVGEFIRQLQLSEVQGIRIYGRRAGQKSPLWSYGLDFKPRQRLVPEATPEFAASDTYVGDLICQSEDAVHRLELSQADVQATITRLYWQNAHRLKQLMLRSKVWVPQVHTHNLLPAPVEKSYRTGWLAAAVWSAVGLLLVVQADWVLGQVLRVRLQSANGGALSGVPALSQSLDSAAVAADVSESERPWQASEFNLNKSGTEPGSEVFNRSGFTNSENELLEHELSEDESLAISGAPLPNLLADSPYPTFKSRQLDEKLFLYHQLLTTSGPPDVMVMGSSRALRGIDPVVLQQSLAAIGYDNASIFNFGINGATAQVVDLTIRRILRLDQLPKLIIWADGARAFNSGRVDITYNGILASEGYQKLLAGDLLPSDQAGLQGEQLDSINQARNTITDRYQKLDQGLDRALGKVSASHGERDRLKDFMRDRLLSLFPAHHARSATLTTRAPSAPTAPGLNPETQSIITANGFLPLSVQFNPATYYQKYARVPGDYDSDYAAFQLDGEQAEAMNTLLQFTQTQDIPVVFVNMPLTAAYLDPTRLEYEQLFQRYMLQLAATQEGFIYRDLGQLWPDQYDYFSDPSHLNRYGAQKVSHRLAQDPIITWPRPES